MSLILKALPNDSISKVFSFFGESEIVETDLAHNYVLYYDYEDKIGLIVCIYQVDKKSIWQITIQKEEGEDAIQKLHENAYVAMLSKQEKSKLYKPKNIDLNEKLTVKGLKLGMSPEEVERMLNTKLKMNGEEAHTDWVTKSGNEVTDYGGLDFVFKKGKLVSLSWLGVDP